MLNKITISLICLGFLGGLMIGYGVLSGDAQGRINLLYVLILFAFLPVLALLLSLGLWVTGSSKGLVSGLLELPVLPGYFADEVKALAGSGHRQIWLIYQTQCVSLSFALGSLLIYLLLLLGSDISFVWRSTLLVASDILPVLDILALPWIFWSEAQPSLDLLQQTQDFRLGNQGADSSVPGQWWKFILAAQITYNLIPRLLMLLIAGYRFRHLSDLPKPSIHSNSKKSSVRVNTTLDNRLLTNVVYTIETPYVFLDWANVSTECQQFVVNKLGASAEIVSADPLVTPDLGKLGLKNYSLVVLVKSWEPPLAELGDYLLALSAMKSKSDIGRHFLLPLDWNDEQSVPVRAEHLDEWRRFCSTLPDWQILQLEGSE